MRRGVALLVGLVLAFGAAAGAVAFARRGPECPALVPPARALPQLVAAEDLAPEGSVGLHRQPVIDAIGGLRGPFGPLVAGRFYDSPAQVPTLVSSGDDLVLAVAHRTWGSLEAIRLPGGGPRWARAYAGAAHGLRVGKAFVVLVGGRAPAVVSFAAADGSSSTCMRVPAAGGETRTLLAAQAGGDVVVVAAGRGAAPTLARIDPTKSAVRWHERLGSLDAAGSVTVADGSVVVGQLGDDPARLADLVSAGHVGGPTVRAYSLRSGAPVWSFPSAADASSTAASVVGSDGDGGLVVLAARRVPDGSATDVRVRLASLDAAGGGVRWTAPLGEGAWGAQVVDGLVVAHGSDPRGGTVLRAFGADDGRERWRVSSRQVPLVGYEARRTFGSVVQVGGSLVVPAPNGLLAIDPSSGRTTRLDSRIAIEQVLPVGDVTVVRTQEALFVLSAP